MNNLYAVIGNPIKHSLSPAIHQSFAAAIGKQISFEPILATSADFSFVVNEFKNRGGKGLSITAPFKEQAWHEMDRLNPRAVIAKAINTIIITPEGELIGDNTDGIGLVRDLTLNKNISITSQSILIFGAGGAVRGLLPSLLRSNPKEIVLFNRTHEKINQLIHEFGNLGSIRPYVSADHSFDLIINTVPPCSQSYPAAAITPRTFCYDLIYGQGLTPFIKWAQQNQAPTADGLGMLIEQAAEAFYLWHGIRPNTDIQSQLGSPGSRGQAAGRRF